ncbi:hypothetical protein ES705_23480 [subsurface metagenome]
MQALRDKARLAGANDLASWQRGWRQPLAAS